MNIIKTILKYIINKIETDKVSKNIDKEIENILNILK